jgi:hypothetical protein
MLALVGQCVFDGTFYPQVHSVTIRKEYLISGEDVQQVYRSKYKHGINISDL